MKASEALTAARSYLMEHGWQQGRYEAPDGKVCAYGALQYAVNGKTGDLVPAGIYQPLREAMGGRLVKFNDASGRTFNEVIDAYDRAIILAKEQEA